MDAPPLRGTTGPAEGRIVIVSDDNSANITPRFVTSLPASAIAGRGRIAEQLREGAGPRRVADRGDDALISSEASKAGQSVAIMSARSPVRGHKLGAVHCAPRGTKSALAPRLSLSPGLPRPPGSVVPAARSRDRRSTSECGSATIAVRRQACFELVSAPESPARRRRTGARRSD
jgi:hypothetical protein